MRILFPLFVFMLAGLAGASGQKPEVIRDGYFGRVKNVITERADLKKAKGKYIESRRRLENNITYGPDGNRSRELSYDYAQGLLREIAVYKTIDGSRVLIFEDGNTPGKIVATSEVPKEKPWDPRFTYSFKYEFDRKGNLLEEAWWQSNGVLWLRYEFSYKGNQKEELVYDGEGKLDQKYLYKLDDRGRILEEVIFDAETNSELERVTYDYLEFDKSGNWTRRRESAGDKETKFILKPREMTYRRHTYY